MLVNVIKQMRRIAEGQADYAQVSGIMAKDLREVLAYYDRTALVSAVQLDLPLDKRP